MPDRPEPNGWELMTAIERLERSIREQSAGFVPVGVFQLFQTQVQDDRAEDRAAAAKTETETKAEIAALRAQIAEGEKEKARNRFALALSIIAVVATILTPVIQRTIGIG